MHVTYDLDGLEQLYSGRIVSTVIWLQLSPEADTAKPAWSGRVSSDGRCPFDRLP